MENYSNYSSYPDSRDSSPRSREIADDAASWEEPQPPSYKAKFMCSYGGKIQPRSHDNQLAYIGGDTKILSVDRSVKLPSFLSKLSSIWPTAGEDLCVKYQLPGEDLDALISVTNDEDLDHMLIEYDRLQRASAKPARLRLFLFAAPAAAAHPNQLLQPHPEKSSSERQWFVDALNSVQIQPPPAEASSSPPAPPPSAINNPDFLFGLDKQAPAPIPDPVVTGGSECGSEEHSAAEIQRQIQDLQRLQIAAQEQAMQRKYEEFGNPRGYGGGGGDYYSQSLKVPEKLPGPPPPANVPAPMPMQVQMQIPASYVSERHVTAGGYHVAPPPQPQTGMEQQQQVYFIQTPSGVYHHHQAAAQMRPMGPQFYGVHQRTVPEAVYREAPAAQVYNPAPNQGIPMMQQQPPQSVPPQQKAEQTGFAQIGYDSSGRQVYYTTTTAPTTATYQNMTPASVDGRLGGGGSGGSAGSLSQDGKVIVGKPSQSSSAM